MLRKLPAILSFLFMTLLGVFSWLFPDPLNSGLFSLSYHNLLKLAAGLGATTLAFLLWLLLQNAGVGFFTRLVCVCVFAVATTCSAYVGYQMGAPSYSMEGLSFVKPKEEVSYATLFEQAGIIFEIKHCVASGSLGKCQIEVKSRGQDREVYLDSDTSLIDGKGNSSRVHSYSVGKDKFGRYKDVVLVADVRNTLTVEFSNLSNDSNEVSLLSLHASYSGLKNVIRFRRVKIQRSLDVSSDKG